MSVWKNDTANVVKEPKFANTFFGVTAWAAATGEAFPWESLGELVDYFAPEGSKIPKGEKYHDFLRKEQCFIVSSVVSRFNLINWIKTPRVAGFV